METRRIGFQADALLEPQEALERYLAAAQLTPPQIEIVQLQHAAGRILAQDAAADRMYPAAPRSAMDGFAVRSADLPGRLRIAGEIRMGSVWDGALASGTAVRIPTGGMLPAGADTVVPIEDAAGLTESDVTLPAAPAGDAVTPAGSDMQAGETILRAGTTIGPAAAGLLATLGFSEVRVFRRPVVGVLSSGDELVEAGKPLGPGQIYDSNRYGIAAALQRMGAEPRHLATTVDDASALEAALRKALEVCDAVVLTGGSSVGERDVTPEVAARLGEPGVIVHGLRVKPGKPTVLAAAGGKPVIGLPGNPGSALTILEMVVRPVFEALAGRAPRPPAGLHAELQSPLRKRKGWTWYVPARLDEAVSPAKAYPLELRSSSSSLLARADVLIVLGEEVESLPAGATVRVRRL
ncbi:MAG TPA: gephyrin-like molybdotransferase Glp [Candidatus Baltobacteraceae bacterium]|nr:gephyrin-like molybdotransferase Glp [Candidatus Baltobacteraceae bacterium]